MSVKTAVYYNLLTGVLSFIGMIFGIIFGQSHDTAQWMFAIAAGLFIYIAMVDMVYNILYLFFSLYYINYNFNFKLFIQYSYLS